MLEKRAVVLSLAACVALGTVLSCSGSTEEGPPAGGSGGAVIDSGVTPDTSLPDTSLPDTSLPDTSLPDTSLPDVSQDVALDIIDDGSLFDLILPDAVIGDGVSVQGCYDCAIQNCNSEIAVCDLDPRCRGLILCFFTNQCWGADGQIDTTCALTCAFQAGVTDPTDPIAMVVLEIGQCALNTCQDECGIDADGGMPFDASGMDI